MFACSFTCVFPLDVGGAGVADPEARHGEPLVSVDVQKVPRHRELQGVLRHVTPMDPETYHLFSLIYSPGNCVVMIFFLDKKT